MDVRLAVAGDRDAFERLYRRHLPRVHRTARWLLGTDDVDDAIQDVFVRVWKKLHTFEGRSAPGTWIDRLAANVLLRGRERLGRRAEREVALEPEAGNAVTVDHTGLRLDLERAVTALPARAREVFVLHDMQGFSHEEIAGVMATNVATSRSQLHRARRLMRQYLMGEAR